MSIHVLADGPGDFLIHFFAGKHARWMDEIGDDGVFANAHLPWKFAEDEIGVGVGSLKVLVDFAKVVSTTSIGHRQLFADAYVVPMAVVLAQIANALVRIEENVFVPIVGNSFDLTVAELKSDDFVIRAAEFAARTQGNQRFGNVSGCFELLKDGQIRILGIEDATATLAHDRFGLTKRAQNDCGTAFRTIQCLHLWLWRSGKWWSACAHHQPSKLRRFLSLRSSNSTNSPRYSAGSGSL